MCGWDSEDDVVIVGVSVKQVTQIARTAVVATAKEAIKPMMATNIIATDEAIDTAATVFAEEAIAIATEEAIVDIAPCCMTKDIRSILSILSVALRAVAMGVASADGGILRRALLIRVTLKQPRAVLWIESFAVIYTLHRALHRS
jgi:hypothetical protein